jgi:adenosylmethionine-8-amino-7-oxononanoate aminotransferase
MTSTQSSRLWRAQAHVPTAFADSTIIVQGDGAYVTTSEGQRLLDATAGLWHANVGHGRRDLAQVAFDQMTTLETYHVFGRFTNNVAEALAERVAGLSPIDDARVFWTSGGSDSVDLACKLALRRQQVAGRVGKRIILSRTNSYHGLHGFGTSIAGLDVNRAGYGTASLVPETARIDPLDIDTVVEQVESIGPDNIAAIIAEPIIGTGGVFPPPPGYLQGLQRLARQHDILLIIDEVITGFGRSGRMFASEREGIEPDMLLVAKGITSGYLPLGGVIAAPSVWGPFFEGPDSPVFRHGLTYSGHATACAVADANISILLDEKLIERAAELETVLHDALRPLSSHPAVVEVRSGYGFIAGIQLREDVSAQGIADACVAAGVIIRALNGNTLQVCPPFIVTAEEVRLIASTIAQALDGPAANP